MSRSQLFLVMVIMSVSSGAMASEESSISKYKQSMRESPHVARCFTGHSSKVIVRTDKRLFFHLYVQASKAKNFTSGAFVALVQDINSQEDRWNGPLIQTKHAHAFYELFRYIPWNGVIDQECGNVYHETLLNNEFANVGIGVHQEKQRDLRVITIVSNNYDDFDCVMDHREKIEREFEQLLKQ